MKLFLRASKALAVSCLAGSLVAQAVPLSTGTILPALDLTVHNAANQARTAEPVTFGIPVSLDLQILGSGALGIIDANSNPVPSQWKTLSRWGGLRSDSSKPVRWAQVTFPATVAANTTAAYRVATNASAAAPVAARCSVAEDATGINVFTATTTWFRISKARFTGFDTVTVNGTPIVTASGRIDANSATGTVLVCTATSTSVEEQSSTVGERVVIAQHGTLGALAYTARWYFHAGRPDVTVDFRLENAAAYGVFYAPLAGGQQYIDRLFLVQPLVAHPTTVTGTVARPISATGSYELRQDNNPLITTPDMLAGLNYNERLNGSITPVLTGARFGGVLDVEAGSVGCTVGIDRFWQNFPKSFKVTGNEIQVGLFPEWGHGPEYKGPYVTPTSPVPVDLLALTNFRIEGGRWKTHRLSFDFHASAARTPTQVQAAVDRLNSPLMGRPSGAWARHTNALGILWGERQPTTPTPTFARLERFYDTMVDDNAADFVQQSNFGKVGLPRFINQGGYPGYQQPFGWENFGDLMWADGYCDLHYDWPLAMILGFYRTGDYRFYDKGRDMAAYRRDMGQNHSTDVGESWRGAAFYEKGWWHGNETVGQQSHTWVHGLLLHYAITGDEGSREAALQCLDFQMRYPPGTWSGWWGTRIPGWGTDALVDGYNYIGDPAYLVAAGQGVARFEQLEVAAGSHGYLLDPGNTPPTSKPWMDNIFFVAAAKYVLASGDHTHDVFLGRMRNFFRNTATVLPSGPANATTLAYCFYEWAPAGSGFANNPQRHVLWPMAEALAYAYAVLGSQADLDLAGVLFDTACNYWQNLPTTGTVNTLDPTTYSQITMRPVSYPNTETKVLSQILHWSTAYMAARNAFNGVW